MSIKSVLKWVRCSQVLVVAEFAVSRTQYSVFCEAHFFSPFVDGLGVLLCNTNFAVFFLTLFSADSAAPLLTSSTYSAIHKAAGLTDNS